MALPLGTTGSLSPAFAPARPVGLTVKHPFCLCTRRAISIRAEGTFGRLRYLLGGDRPSQTAHLTLSPNRIHGPRLELQYPKGGIPPAAPEKLAPLLLSLPPILYIRYQNPMSGYSKAPRGLSVLPQVTSICTGTTISPSPSSRQRPSRYAFRAGRNLPDKEFRYLRTVIVTAAVYRGFGSELLRSGTWEVGSETLEGIWLCQIPTNISPLTSHIPPLITPPLNLPALGRRQPLYLLLRVEQGPVFLVNSRLGLVSATPAGLRCETFTRRGTPSPEVTGSTCRVP